MLYDVIHHCNCNRASLGEAGRRAELKIKSGLPSMGKEGPPKEGEYQGSQVTCDSAEGSLCRMCVTGDFVPL